MRRPTIFLDRDDTLIANSSLDWSAGPSASPKLTPGDLCDPNRVRLLPAALEGCRLLHAAGYQLVMVTNQGLVARGGGSLADVERTNDRVRELLTFNGSPLIAATYACPMHPKGNLPRFTREHPWRKPAGGMIRAAADELDLDLARSWLVGDAERDIEAAVDAGIARERTIRVGGLVPDLLAATLIILAQRTTPSGLVTGRLTAAPLAAPLADDAVRRIVVATAHAIAERVGVELVEIRADDAGVAVTLRGSRVTAMGFLAELRRLTNRWHRDKLGSDLWPTTDRPPPDAGWLDPPDPDSPQPDPSEPDRGTR